MVQIFPPQTTFGCRRQRVLRIPRNRCVPRITALRLGVTGHPTLNSIAHLRPRAPPARATCAPPDPDKASGSERKNQLFTGIDLEIVSLILLISSSSVVASSTFPSRSSTTVGVFGASLKMLASRAMHSPLMLASCESVH